MADTLSIRLTGRDRETLEAEAQRSGTELSSLVRSLAEAEAKRLRSAAIRAQGKRVVEYLKTNPEARAEFELLGTPQTDLPDEDWSGNGWGI
jgi:hypothetical protein